MSSAVSLRPNRPGMKRRVNLDKPRLTWRILNEEERTTAFNPWRSILGPINRIHYKDSKKNIFIITLFSILIAASFFRTYNYPNRIFVQADNSQHVQVGKYAADKLKIPQVGPFSSAGPFFYGPWYFWLLELFSFLPFGFLTNWYFITILYTLFIPLIYWLGKEIGGKLTGIVAALYAAISPAQITYSFSVWSPTIVPSVVLLALTFFVRFYKFKRKIDIFWVCIFVSLAATIHFQNMLISPILAIVILTVKPTLTNYLKYFLPVVFGLIIPFIPLLYFDLKFHWYNSINLAIFLLVDQFKIWVPNRWLTYLVSYWPDAWGYIIGGNRLIGGLLIVILSILFLVRIASYKKYKLFFLIAIIFILEIFLYRYYRGQRFEYYSLFAHPTVLVLSAWLTVELLKIKKYIGIILLSLVIIFSIKRVDLGERGVTLSEIRLLKEELYAKFPGMSFDIYACERNVSSISHPLALLMYYEGRSDTSGVKIGVCEDRDFLQWHHLTEKNFNMEKTLWFNKNTSTVYEDTVEWWIKNPPIKGEGDFWKFIRQNSPLVPSIFK